MIYQRIRYFLKAAETGSFSKAASLVYVSAQGLTKQIGLLEEEIGGKLFFRSPQGVTLTRLGEYAKERFEKIDQEIDAAFSELKLRAKDDKERINIGIFSALPQEKLVTPVLSFLLANFHDYRMELNLMSLDEGKRQLLAGNIDMLLTNTHMEDDWKGNRCLSFAEHPAKVVVSLLHPWAVKQELTPEDLKRETLLKMKMTECSYTVPAESTFYKNIPCRSIQEVTNFDTMYMLLQQGESFAVFPLAFTQMEKAKIKTFDYPGDTLIFHTAVIYDPHSKLKGINEIAQALEEEFDLQEIRHPATT